MSTLPRKDNPKLEQVRRIAREKPSQMANILKNWLSSEREQGGRKQP